MTFTPPALGKSIPEQADNLVSLLNGYFSQEAHHLNVNVLSRSMLEDAMQNPTLYPDLTDPSLGLRRPFQPSLPRTAA